MAVAATAFLLPQLTTTIDGGDSNGNNDGYDQPITWGLLQPPPLGGAIGRDVCLTVIGDGVVGIGVRLLVVRLLVGGAIGRDVGLMIVGNGVVRLAFGLLVGRLLDVGDFFFNKCCRLMFSILPAPSRSHLCRHLPPARATTFLSGAANGHHCHRYRHHCQRQHQG
jgi:hypothetical protein